MVDADVQRVEAAGVPIFWAKGPQPFTGGMMFRVGRADETLITCGITHLVEHLALSGIGRRPYRWNGRVEGAYTLFVASGRREEVVAHLQEVATALTHLPLERLESERLILSTEESGRSAGLESRMLAMRFGPVGYGLTNHAEIGCDWVGEQELRRWTATNFTLGNVAVWFNDEPPEDFTLELPEGSLRPPPPVEKIPGLALPSYVTDGTGGVAISLLVRRSSAATVAGAVMVERMIERMRAESNLSYSPTGFYLPLDDELAHVIFNADCQDRDAARALTLLLELFDELASDGPTAEELAHDLELFVRSQEDPESAPGFAVSYARDHLLGHPYPDPRRLADERRALTPDAVAAALADGARGLMVLAPDGVPRPNRWMLQDYRPESRDAISGRRVETTPEWQALEDRSVFEISETAIRYEPRPGGDAVTWRLADLQAGVRTLSGALTIVGREGYWIKLRPHRYQAGHALMHLLERALADRIAPLGPRETELRELVEAELPAEQIGHVSEELDGLPSVIGRDEQVRHLAEATRGHTGLLVLTDERVMFLLAGSQGLDVWEKPLAQVRVSGGGMVRKKLVLEADDGKTELRSIKPSGRLQELLAAL